MDIVNMMVRPTSILSGQKPLSSQRRQPRRTLRPAAFSLIEILISITLLSVIVLLMYGFVDGVSRVWVSAIQRAEVMTGARGGLHVIFQDLSQGVFHADTPAFVDSEGKPDFSFFSIQNSLEGTDSRLLSLVRYQLTRSTNSEALPSLRRSVTELLTSGSNKPAFYSASSEDRKNPMADNSGGGSAPYHPVVDGVFRWNQIFLDAKGEAVSSYWNAEGYPQAASVVVSMGLIDQRSWRLLSPTQQTELQADRSDALFRPSRPGETSIVDIWQEALSQPTALELPEPSRRGIRVFERTIPLSVPRQPASPY